MILLTVKKFYGTHPPLRSEQINDLLFADYLLY